MPAFLPKATPTPAQTADTATPLSDLHTNPPVPPPAATDVVKPAVRKAARRTVRVPRIVPGVLQSTLPVLKLQQVLNSRGAKLVPDGLFGPKTAAAWSKLAAAKALPPSISRVAPKLAQVVTHTYDALSMPVIP
jgi:peptidoglycan hydrolase-like protein with peptidoglycan-binding domain